MELIGYYLLFAFSISISTCYFWFWPLVQEATSAEILNSFTQYPKLSAIVYILVSAVVAPLLVFPMFSEDKAIKFESGLRKEILKADSEK